MCVTDDDTELIEMQQWAKKRIDEVFKYNYQRIRKSEDKLAFRSYAFRYGFAAIR